MTTTPQCRYHHTPKYRDQSGKLRCLQCGLRDSRRWMQRLRADQQVISEERENERAEEIWKRYEDRGYYTATRQTNRTPLA